MQVQPIRPEIAWAAGLFEGEGCWNAYVRPSGKIQMQIRLGMSDLDVVERFRDIVGCGAIHKRPPSKKGHKPIFEWCVYEAKKVREITDLLLPFMGERRRLQAERTLSRGVAVRPHFGDRTHCPQGHLYEGENLWLEHRKNGTIARVCRTCKVLKGRERMRKKKGITPDRFRIQEN